MHLIIYPLYLILFIYWAVSAHFAGTERFGALFLDRILKKEGYSMSLLYSILKPIVRRVVKGSSLHQEESYDQFKQASYDVQKKFQFALPKIKGFAFRDEQLGGFHIIVGKMAGTNPDKAIVYFPGGGSRKWQLPYKSSMKNYIRQTGGGALDPAVSAAAVS